MIVRALALLLGIVGIVASMSPAAQATPDNFSPRPGVTLNNPLAGADGQRAIYRRIVRSIDSSPRGSEISIFSWNVLTEYGVDRLLRAERRGVQVRVIMSRSNLTQLDNPGFERLRANLRRGNDRSDRRNGTNSWARVCGRSCRGDRGAAHTKMYLFSHAGKSKRVVMQGSANFTVASTSNQWNDMYTHVGNRDAWQFANRVFREAARDKPARPKYVTTRFGHNKLIMFPNVGNQVSDPVMGLLRQIKCRGAQNTPDGRTVIRIAPDVIRQSRGMWLATKVRQLWEDGCPVRIGYTVMGIDVGRMLREDKGRGPVPMKHLVQDFDGDGEFDNYFHLKTMTVVGNVGRDRSAYVTLNGSANWSSFAKTSDENLGIYRHKRRTLKYQEHINYWYENFPPDGSGRNAARRLSTAPPSDERLIFGTGTNAIYEDGEPVGDADLNPFANMPQD